MKIAVMEFGSKTVVHAENSSDKDDLYNAVECCRGRMGGTQGALGLSRALAVLKKGSKDLLPRIVMTSDGELHDPMESINQALKAKDRGVVIDTILIGDSYRGAEQLRKIAEITGGVFEQIKTADEFEQKFLNVMNRKLLSA
jgi:Mg-chelatase subunit ChlD